MTLILSQREVRELLSMEACMACVERALVELAEGNALNPLRSAVIPPGGDRLLGLMPGWLGTPEALGLKVVGVFEGNHGGELESHQGIVALFDPRTGVPMAILDGSEVTGIRTAAASGVATRVLAREDAGDLALLGSGVQAWTHLMAMGAVRSLRRVRVYSPSSERCGAFVERAREELGQTVEAVDSAETAVREADLICLTTSAREPVLRGDWLSPGAHLNAVGSCAPQVRELDGAAVARARLFTDNLESARNEAGDYLLACEEGAIEPEHLLGVLGDVLRGTLEGRREAQDITLFESLGIAVEDLATAVHVVERARELGVGTEVDLGGRRGPSPA